MVTKPNITDDSLTGQLSPAEASIGLQRVERQLVSDLKEQHERRLRLSRLRRRINAPLLTQLADDQEALRALEELRRAKPNLDKPSVPRARAVQRMGLEQGATLTPPYSYQWVRLA